MTYTKIITTAIVLSVAPIFSSCEGQDHKSVERYEKQVNSASFGNTVAKVGEKISYIFKDDKSNFWFATDGEGVFRYDGRTILQLTDKYGLSGNFVRCIQQGKDGMMLFETDKGVSLLNDNQFQTIEYGENASAQIDPQNITLLSGCYYQNQSLKKIRLPETSKLLVKYSQTPYAIYCSYKDRKGNIWFGTESRGVCKYDGKTFTWFDSKELGLAIRSIFEDSNGNIWIGNNGYGLFRYDGKTLTNITREHNLANPDFIKDLKSKDGTLARVWTITEDRLGNIWIGTIDAGLWKYDGRSFSNYTMKDGLYSNSVAMIYCNDKGNLWIGLSDKGMMIFDGKKFAPFKVPQ